MKCLLPLLLLAHPALADDLDDRAKVVFKTAFAEPCQAAFLEDGSLVDPPQRFAITSASSYDAPEPMVFWQFRCNIGAYNVQSVILGQSEYYGIHPMAFPRPELKITYQDPENEESAVVDVKIIGWSASVFVTNAVIDPVKGQVVAASYWRGMGDASDTSLWRLIDEDFRLVHFEVDPSYDGKVTLQTIVDFP